MKFRINTVFLLSLIFKGVEPGRVIKAIKNQEVVEAEYIVVLKPNKSGSGSGKNQGAFAVSDVGNYVSSASSQILSMSGLGRVNILSQYSSVLSGFAVNNANAKDVDIMARNELVDYIEPNYVVKASDVTWGLDRVDQRDLPLDNSYGVTLDGTGVTAYILDTGVQVSHNEFGNRAIWGKNTSGDNQDRDCHGHGTHVAGTVGGAEYGVAKNVNIVAVKVLTCSGSGSTAGVIAGVEWVKNDAVEKKATANMSLGGGSSTALNDAVRYLHNSGVPTVVAAGNDNGNACSKSPAGEPAVITVGSTTRTDARSSFSNFGECVDIFAPGSSITAAWIGNSNTQLNTISGTSMASPHVCGGVALLLQEGIPAAEIATEIVSRATKDKVTDPRPNSPNELLYVGVIGPTNAPTPAPPTPAPTACIQEDLVVTIKTDNYPSETSWKFENTCPDGYIEESAPAGTYTSADTEYVEAFCVPAGQYKFTIVDSYGDGMCCSYGSGSYKVTYGGNEVGGAEFGASEEKTIGSCESNPSPTEAPTVPAPVDSPVVSPVVTPTAPVVSSTDVPSVSPTDAPSFPPTDAPSFPPTDAPSVPPTDAPSVPPTDTPSVPPMDAPSVPPMDTPVVTDAPSVPPTTAAPVVPPTDAPVISPTSDDGFEETLSEDFEASPYDFLPSKRIKTMPPRAGTGKAARLIRSQKIRANEKIEVRNSGITEFKVNFDVWAKNLKDGDTLKIRFKWLPSRVSATEILVNKETLGDKEWQSLEETVVVPTVARFAIFELKAAFSTVRPRQSQVYIDNVTVLQKVEE